MNYKNKLFQIALVESIYIFYMFNFFKTTIYFHHPLEMLIQDNNSNNINNFLKHPISDSSYSSKICPLGNLTGFLLPFWIFGFYSLSNKDYKKFFCMNMYLWIFIGIIALIMNLNAFIYLIPCYFLEYFSYNIRMNN